MPSWLYDTTGWLLLAAGLPLLAWSLLWDPARRRRRCPRCWYSLEGTPGLRCPECGREARSERSLHRVRRRWRWAAVALLMLVGAYVAAVCEGVRARGWWATVPRPVLALLISRLPSTEDWRNPPSLLEVEIRRRFLETPHRLRSLWPGERWVLGQGAVATLGEPASEPASALAAELLVLARDDAVTAAPSRAKARVVIASSELAYATCTSYFDVGMVSWHAGPGGESVFSTAFAVPDHLRFEYAGYDPARPGVPQQRVTACGTGSALYVWHQGSLVRGSSLYTSAKCGGDWSEPAHRIAEFFERNPSALLLGYPRDGREETFDGRRCYAVRTSHQVIWFDAESFAVRKIQELGAAGWTLVCRPEFNAELAPELFRYRPGEPSPIDDAAALKDAMRHLCEKVRRQR